MVFDPLKCGNIKVYGFGATSIILWMCVLKTAPTYMNAGEKFISTPACMLFACKYLRTFPCGLGIVIMGGSSFGGFWSVQFFDSPQSLRNAINKT